MPLSCLPWLQGAIAFSKMNIAPVSLHAFRLGLFTLFLASIAAAQTPDTATLRGQASDQSGAAVAGVDVTIQNTLTGLKRKVTSDGAGRFVLAALPVAGSYDVSAVKSGFDTANFQQIALAGGTAVSVNLQLNVAGEKTEFTVTGAAGEARTDSAQLGELLSSRQMENTPLRNRRITYLPLLSAANRPAINQGDVFMNQNLFTTNGAGRRQTWFEIDGVTGNDSWGRQTLFTNIPLAAVQEMGVLSNAFSAEYGGGAGSVVNIITKSGGNNFHGEAFGLSRPSATEAALSGFNSGNAASGNDLTNDTLAQGGLTLSGPIGASGHTQFFVSGEYSWQNRASPVTSPIAPGSFIGHYRNWLGLLRLDHQFSERNNAFFRSSADDFFDTNPNGTVGGNNLPSVGRVFRKRTFSEELGDTALLTPGLINTLRVQFQLASPITEFAPSVYGTQFIVPIPTGGTFTSGTSQSALLMNRQYELTDTLAASVGKHQVKFGGDSIFVHTGGNGKEFGGPIYLGQLTYNTCTQVLSVCESANFLNNIANVRTYTQSYGNANYTVDDILWSLFIQDDYHVRSDLTINAGLRYEQQTFTDSRASFAPQVGFAYNWKGDGKTIIRGGFGIYYSQIVDNSQANYALTGPTGVFNYTAGPGQVGFPTNITDVPLPGFPATAAKPLRNLYIRPGNSRYLDQFFPTSTLVGYPDQLVNPYTEQWTFGVQRQLPSGFVLSADYVGSHTIRINRPLDVDAPAPFIRTHPGQLRSPQAANCTRPYWIWWYQQNALTCDITQTTNPQPPYSTIQSDVNNGYSYYHALDVNVSRRFSNGFSVLASYTWSHAIDNVDPDIPNQNPNDANFTGRLENGNAIFDQRHRFVLSGVYTAPFKITVGMVSTLASGLPYNFVTGTTNSGDTGATTDRPVINGVVVGRNTGSGGAIYSVDPFVQRPFTLFAERLQLTLRAEAFNVLNHANFVGYSSTYGNGAIPGRGFGQPLAGITNQLPARSMQFSARLTF